MTDTPDVKTALDNSWDKAKRLGEELFELQKQQLNAKENEACPRVNIQQRIYYVRRQARMSEIYRLLAYRSAA